MKAFILIALLATSMTSAFAEGRCDRVASALHQEGLACIEEQSDLDDAIESKDKDDIKEAKSDLADCLSEVSKVCSKVK